MTPDALTITAFQNHISDRYEKPDRERGTPGTWLHFSEEIGELARALARNDRANLEEEFADVLAWLCTLANINDVDLAAAVTRKYLSAGSPSEPRCPPRPPDAPRLTLPPPTPHSQPLPPLRCGSWPPAGS